jgi:brefeldin A-inhibited guanine nucleotide-exchange protein
MLLVAHMACPDGPRHRAFFSSVLIKCLVQLELVHAMRNVVLGGPIPDPSAPSADEQGGADTGDLQGGVFDDMDTDHILAVVDCLLESNEFAKRFDDNMELRSQLWKAGTWSKFPLSSRAHMRD